MEALIKGYLTKKIDIILQVHDLEDLLSISLDQEKAYEVIQRMIIRGAKLEKIELRDGMTKCTMSISEEDIFN